MWEGKLNEIANYNSLNEPTEVICLDECLIFYHKQISSILSFDEKLCDGWHLYAADLCYCAIVAGLKVMVVPLNVWHKSHGNVDFDYVKTQDKLARKYRKHYRKIITMNSYAYANPVLQFFLKIHRGRGLKK